MYQTPDLSDTLEKYNKFYKPEWSSKIITRDKKKDSISIINNSPMDAKLKTTYERVLWRKPPLLERARSVPNLKKKENKKWVNHVLSEWKE